MTASVIGCTATGRYGTGTNGTASAQSVWFFSARWVARPIGLRLAAIEHALDLPTRLSLVRARPRDEEAVELLVHLVQGAGREAVS